MARQLACLAQRPGLLVKYMLRRQLYVRVSPTWQLTMESHTHTQTQNSRVRADPVNMLVSESTEFMRSVIVRFRDPVRLRFAVSEFTKSTTVFN